MATGCWRFPECWAVQLSAWKAARRLFIITSGGHGLPSLYRPVNLVRRSPVEKQNPR